MNAGTIIRTILVIATCFNTALLATDVAQFHNPKLDLIYKVLSVIANFIIVFCATWFNNDYTEVAARHTGDMRQEKLEMKDDYVGERFFVDADGEPIEAMFPEDEAVFDEDEADIEEEGDDLES